MPQSALTPPRSSPQAAPEGFRPNAFGRLARWVLGHRLAVWIGTAVVALMAGLIGLPPQIDSNLLNLLPDSDPQVAALQRLNEEEGGLNLLTLTYESDDPAVLDAFLDDLVVRFQAMDDVAFAMHELDPDLARQIALLQLEPEETAELVRRLEGALALGPAARNPMVMQRLMDMGPLTEKIAQANDNPIVRPPEDGRGRLVVRPTRTSADPVFAKEFMGRVDALLAEADAAGKGIRLLWMGGAYRHNVEDVEGISRDLAVTSVASFVLVLGIMMAALRSPRAVLIFFPPLLLANVLTFAFVRLAIGPLNTYTSFATAILLGLGIDFAIHLLGRYREYRAAGREQDEALIVAWHHVGPPCTTAALTSAAGFLALATADFAGFAQLGVVLSFGLLASLGCMLVLLPVLVVALDRGTVLLLGAGATHGPSRSTYRLSAPGVAALVALTVVVGVTALPRITYEYDVSALRRDGLAYDELSGAEQKLARQSYSPVVVFFDGAGDRLEAEQERVEQLIRDGELPHVAAAVSIANVLPSDQDERNARIRDLVGLLDHENMRYLPAQLTSRLMPLKGLEVRTLTRDDLPEPVTLLLGGSDPSSPRMMLLPKGNMWDVREGQALREEVARALPDRLATGEYLGVAAMFLMAFRDAPWVAGVALFLITVLAFIDLRRPHAVLAVMGSLVAGLVWAGAALALFDVKLSMVNLAGIPILLGIGVDVVIHLVHRIQEEGPGGIRRALRTSGVAAGLSTLTSIASFLALTFAGSRSIRSLGWLVVIGLLVVSAVGMSALPLLWSAGWKLRGQAPGDAPEARDEVA